MLVKKKLLLIISILTLLTLGILGFALIPSIFAIEDLKQKISEEQLKFDTRYALRLYVRNSTTTLLETWKQLALISTIAVHEDKGLNFIQSLEAIANENHLDQKIELETANQKILSPWEREIPFKLTQQGSYIDILHALRAIEHLPYSLIIGTVDIIESREGNKTGSEGIVNAIITSSVYWQEKNVPKFIQSPPLPLQ